MSDEIIYPTISAINYCLGDKKREISSIHNYEMLFEKNDVPFIAELLGCKEFYELSLPLFDLLSACISRTLSESNLEPVNIQMIVVTSSNISILENDKSLIGNLLHKHGLINALPLFLSLQECTSTLAGIDIACKYLQSPGVENILLLSFDVIKNEENRIQAYGVLSDAVSSCIIKYKDSGFKILAYSNKLDLYGLLGQSGFDSRKRAATESLSEVLRVGNFTKNSIKLIFSTNFFKFLSDFNADSIGIPKNKLYVKTANSFSHCLGSDPLINLSHFLESNSFEDGDYFILQSYATGFSANILIRNNC